MKKFITNKKIKITFLSCLIVVVLVIIGITAMKMVAKNSSIGVEAAKKFALIDAGVKEKKVKDMDVKFMYKDSTYVYDVEFDTNKREYSYFVKASNGVILEKKVIKKKKASSSKKKGKKKKYKKSKKKTKNKDKKIKTKKKIQETTKKLKAKVDDQEEIEELIGVDEAKDVAINSSGADPSDVVFTVARLSRNGTYQLQFYAGDTEYNYVIDASDGSVISSEYNNYDNDDANNENNE